MRAGPDLDGVVRVEIAGRSAVARTHFVAVRQMGRHRVRVNYEFPAFVADNHWYVGSFGALCYRLTAGLFVAVCNGLTRHMG